MTSRWPGSLDDNLLHPNDEGKGVEVAEGPALPPVNNDNSTSIAACFLMDYEASRPPTFSTNIDGIDTQKLQYFRLQFSVWWRWLGLYPATILLFVSNFESRGWTAVAHILAIAIFVVDIHLRYQISSSSSNYSSNRIEHGIQRSFLVFLTLMAIQTSFWPFVNNPETHFSTLMISVFKPLVFFYLSRRARDALEALTKIGSILLRVIVIEMFLILTFAGVACRLYYDDENFQNLAVSWLSLFQLSTTVVNPSLWLPVYAENSLNAIFFVIFIVVCVFYLHSLTLSVVFQVFIQAATEVHNRSMREKDECIRCAFLALSSSSHSPQPIDEVASAVIRRTLRKVRPHYSDQKINILMQLVDPQKTDSISYGSFRIGMREALNSSVRSVKQKSVFSNAVDTLSVTVTIVNFLYVTLLTSHFPAQWFVASVALLGIVITLLAMVEVLCMANAWNVSFYPKARLNAVFDTFTMAGVTVSCYGVVLYLLGDSSAGLDYLYIGRAIDMVRTMRFFSIFRDVVERSVNVLPSLAGPVFLVLSTVHVFVCLGIVLWGDAIDVDQLSQSKDLEYLYYLNNFNSYSEGLVTIFNVLVINDWHQIARVFLFADKCSEPYVVYPYFVSVVLVAVGIMLNVITAFFVETFISRLSKNDMESDGVIELQKARGEFSVRTPKMKIPPATSTQFSWQAMMADEPLLHSRSSMSTESGELMQYDVYEKQGLDRIMESVANTSSDHEQIAKCLCETLQSVMALAMPHRILPSGRPEFLVCSRGTLTEYETKHFRVLVGEYVDQFILQGIVNEARTLQDSQSEMGNSELTPVTQYSHPLQRSRVLEVSIRHLRHVKTLTLVTVCEKELS